MSKQKKAKKMEASKLSPAATDTILGWQARINEAAGAVRALQQRAQAVVGELLGEGYNLEQREDGLWRVPLAEE